MPPKALSRFAERGGENRSRYRRLRPKRNGVAAEATTRKIGRRATAGRGVTSLDTALRYVTIHERYALEKKHVELHTL